MLTIDETTTLSELLTAHPQALSVLLSHGMCDECREDPPSVPLRHFAAKHSHSNIEGLLEQLRRSAGVDYAS